MRVVGTSTGVEKIHGQAAVGPVGRAKVGGDPDGEKAGTIQF